MSCLQENGQPRWKQISNYQEAEDWKKLVAEHRHIRLPLYEQIADVKVNVSGLSIREVMHKVDDILSEKYAPSYSMQMCSCVVTCNSFNNKSTWDKVERRNLQQKTLRRTKPETKKIYKQEHKYTYLIPIVTQQLGFGFLP